MLSASVAIEDIETTINTADHLNRDWNKLNVETTLLLQLKTAQIILILCGVVSENLNRGATYISIFVFPCDCRLLLPFSDQLQVSLCEAQRLQFGFNLTLVADKVKI